MTPDAYDDLQLPPDPDFDDVPVDLLALDGRQVTDADGNVATMLVVPELWGHARRYREGFYDQPDGAA